MAKRAPAQKGAARLRRPAAAADNLDLAEARRLNVPLPMSACARIWRKSTHTFRDAIRANALPAHRIGSRRYEIYPADVDAWIRNHRVESARDRARRPLDRRRE
jgi:excisionase family DNA binding protein